MVILLLGILLQTNRDPVVQAVEKVNAARKAAGLAPVVLDPALSRGCSAHAAYLVKNEGHPSVQGLRAHAEDKALPGWSAEGEKAGASSDIHFVDPVAAVEGWMASFFHRVPILHPRLKRVGLGTAQGGKWGWVTLLDVMSGRDGGKAASPVLWPPDKASDVPLAFGGEIPDPIPQDKDKKAGYPITAIFANGESVKEATATLVSNKQEIEGWFSSPEKPAEARYQANTICIVPKDPLDPRTTYTVTLLARVNGRPWTKTWSFMTRAR